MLDGKWEIFLYFGAFKNIDLYRQGLYYFRASVYTKETMKNKGKKSKEVKKPFLASEHFENTAPNRVETSLLTEEEVKLNPAQILNGRTQFVTRCFRVRYQDQRTEINESCIFGVLMPIFRKKTVFIDIDLVFADRDSDEYHMRGIKGLERKFKLVETTTFVIEDLTSIHGMHPVTFSEQHFCLLDLQIHVEFLSLDTTISSPKEWLSQKKVSSVTKIVSAERQFEIPTKKEWGIMEAYRKQYLKLLLQSHCSLRAIVNDYSSIKSGHRSQILRALGVSQYPIKEYELPGKWKQNNGSITTIKSFYEMLIVGVTREEKLAANKLTNSEVWDRMLRDLGDIRAKVNHIWRILVRSVPFFRSHVLMRYFQEWQKEIVERMGVKIFRETDFVSNRAQYTQRGTDIEHEYISKKMKKQKWSVNKLFPAKVQNQSYMVSPKLQAVIFEQSFNAIPEWENQGPDSLHVPQSIKVKQPCQGYHVIVLVHGYHGSTFDMSLFKNHLQVILEHSDTYPLFLISKVNEMEKTEGDIRDMGRRLAEEVDVFIKLSCGTEKPRRISFVTHSLGGIIARAAFVEPALAGYIKYFWTFFSLAVCHAGHLFGTVLVRGTLAVLRKVNKIQSLTQLSLTEDGDPRKCFMYYLSYQKGLEYFKHVLLFSSPADKYAPYHSARIELINQDLPLATVYNEMCSNLLKPLENTYLTRFDVLFTKKHGFWSDQVGRSAHVFFLDQARYVDVLLNAYKVFFE